MFLRLSQCYSLVNLRHLKRGDSFGNFDDFKAQKSSYRRFEHILYRKKFENSSKLVVLVAIYDEDVRSIFYSYMPIFTIL